MIDLRAMRIGFVPNSLSLDAPGDRRRFVHYAKMRNLQFEIADPAKKYDVVILSERADLSIWSSYQGGILVFDLIDSYLAIPRTDIKGCFRGLAKFVTGQSKYLQLNHWKAIELMCRSASAVICTTYEQKLDISKFCSNVHVILDSHSGVTRTIKHKYAPHRPFRLVWEGLPYTLVSMNVIQPVLERISARYPIEIYLLTDREYFYFLGRYGRTSTLRTARRLLPNVKLIEWKEETAADIICSCDLAIIPIDLSDPFAFGKPENKLVLFWRMGMPVLTSATPAYVRAMSAAGLSMTCATNEEWAVALEVFITDELKRRVAGECGLRFVEVQYSEVELLRKWDAVFQSVFPLPSDMSAQRG
jgi:hypothetical protein